MGNEVECTACGLRLQVRGKGKFEIERHWEQKHKDRGGRENASFKLVADGFHNVDNLWKKKAEKAEKDGGGTNVEGGDKVEEETGVDDLELQESVGKESRKRDLNEIESEGEDRNGNLPKKAKGDVVEATWTQ